MSSRLALDTSPQAKPAYCHALRDATSQGLAATRRGARLFSAVLRLCVRSLSLSLLLLFLAIQLLGHLPFFCIGFLASFPKEN